MVSRLRVCGPMLRAVRTRSEIHHGLDAQVNLELLILGIVLGCSGVGVLAVERIYYA